MRQVTTGRWLVIHAFVVGVVVLFLWLGWWQLQRAEAGNMRSVAYMLEWPTFALMAFGFWIKIVYDEFHPGEIEAIAERAGGTATSKRRRPDPRSDAEVAELAAYNRYVADLANQQGRR